MFRWREPLTATPVRRLGRAAHVRALVVFSRRCPRAPGSARFAQLAGCSRRSPTRHSLKALNPAPYKQNKPILEAYSSL
jgi:hypothetical protein